MRVTFSYHRESVLRLALLALPLLVLGDVLLVEIVLLPRLAPWAAWMIRIASIASFAQLVLAYLAMRRSPHVLENGILTLRRGRRAIAIPVDQIVSITPLPDFADDWKKRAFFRGAKRFDVPAPSTLELRTTDGSRVIVAVDDPAALRAALRM